MCRVILTFFLFLICVARLNTAPLHYIISGAPGVGKTTVVEILAAAGFSVLPEIFTEFHDKAQQDPQCAAWYQNDLSRNICLTSIQIARENCFDVSKITFLDRCALECRFFTEYFRMPFTQDMKRKIFWQERTYNKAVFILEPLPRDCYQQTPCRRLTYEESLMIHHFLMTQYIKCGFSVILVPYAAPEVRAQFILNHVEAQIARAHA